MKGKIDEKSINPEADRILISFYLSTDTIEKLEDVLFYARKCLPVGKRRKLTKSVLYEIGLKMVIEDYHGRGEESSLIMAINELAKK